MRKRLLHFGHPDIMSLLQRKDLPGLVRALQDKSPDVVRNVARAIASLHRQGDEAERQQEAATAPALMDALTRVCGAGWAYRSIAVRSVGQEIIRALGEIRAAGAREMLMRVVSDNAHDQVDRWVAMPALARVAGTAMGPWFVSLLDGPDRGHPASFALLALEEDRLIVRLPDRRDHRAMNRL